MFIDPAFASNRRAVLTVIMEIEISKAHNNKTLESLLIERCESINKENDVIVCKPKTGKLVTLIRFLIRNRIPYKLITDQ